MIGRLYILAAAIIITAACTAGSGNTGSSSPAPQQPVEDLTPAPASTQQEQILVSKGVIRSENEIYVYSRITGQLDDVTLKEGRKVRKGEVLFTLDDQELRANVELCEAELEQANLLMEEALIGQGYKRSEFGNVPENVRELAKIKSGVNVREKELEIARAKLERARIKAPVSGIVSNVKPTPYAFVSPGEELCQVIDTQNLIVEFSILETELRRFQLGSTIKVFSVAYNDVEHKAVVSTIGSIVDEAGMISIEARLTDSENLMPGMTAIIKL